MMEKNNQNKMNMSPTLLPPYPSNSFSSMEAVNNKSPSSLSSSSPKRRISNKQSQSFITPTSYRGGYLLLILASSSPESTSTSSLASSSQQEQQQQLLLQPQQNQSSPFQSLQITNMRATSTHLAITLFHKTLQRYCLIVLDLIPLHLSIPSYVDVKRFLIRFYKGHQPKLLNTLVFYPNSTPISIQFITKSKIGTSLMIATKLGGLQFYSFQMDSWEWRSIGSSFNVLHMQDQIGTAFKTLDIIIFHESTATLTWIEKIEQENRAFLKCCPLPPPLCDPLGVETSLSHSPYTPENIVSTLYQLNSLNSLCHLLPTASISSVSCWIFTSKEPVIPQPTTNDSPDCFSTPSSLSSSHHPEFHILENETGGHGNGNRNGSGNGCVFVRVIDYRVNQFASATLLLPSLDHSSSIISLISTPLPCSASSKCSLESCLVIVQLESHSTHLRKCYLYYLRYISGIIEISEPFPITCCCSDNERHNDNDLNIDNGHDNESDNNDFLITSCGISDNSNSLYLIYQQSTNKNEIPLLFYTPLDQLLHQITHPHLISSNLSSQWTQYKTHTSFRGTSVNFLHSSQDSEWVSEVHKFYYQQLFHTCLYTDIGELLELRRDLTSHHITRLPKPTIQSKEINLKDLTDKLFFTNKLINPNPPPLVNLIREDLYTPHKWSKSLSNSHVSGPKQGLVPDVQRKKRSYSNSLFLYSNVAVLPSYTTLRELWSSRNTTNELAVVRLPNFESESTSQPPENNPENQHNLIILKLLYTLFTTDTLFINSLLENETPLQDFISDSIVNYFIDIDRYFANQPPSSSSSSHSSSSDHYIVNYLDLQDVFVSCHKYQSIDDLLRPEDEYLELCVWYLFKYHPSSLPNFIHHLLLHLSSKQQTNSSFKTFYYHSFNKLNKIQQLILSRCLLHFEFLMEWKSNEQELNSSSSLSSLPSLSCLSSQQRLYLTLCSFSNDGVFRIVKNLCQWHYWDVAIEFTCRILSPYNSERVRAILGDRWNNYSSSSSHDNDIMRWDNPLDPLINCPSDSEDDAEEEKEDSGARSNLSERGEGEEEGNEEWDNTWKDVSGSDSDPTPSITHEDHIDESISQIGDSVMGLVWDDVESDDEEESDHVCWKHFAKHSRVIFITCLKAALLAGDISLACKLISNRPLIKLSPHENGVAKETMDNETKISDLNIISIFEEIYEQQQREEQEGGGEEKGEEEKKKILTGDDLRNCINSFNDNH